MRRWDVLVLLTILLVIAGCTRIDAADLRRNARSLTDANEINGVYANMPDGSQSSKVSLLRVLTGKDVEANAVDKVTLTTNIDNKTIHVAADVEGQPFERDVGNFRFKDGVWRRTTDLSPGGLFPLVWGFVGRDIVLTQTENGDLGVLHRSEFQAFLLVLPVPGPGSSSIPTLHWTFPRYR